MPGRVMYLVLICVALLLLSPAVLAQDNEYVCSVRVTGTERANIRQSADAGAAVVARLEPGQVAVAVDKLDTPQGSWYQLESGWVAAWVVEPAGNAVEGYQVVKLAGSPYSGAFDVEVPAEIFFGSVCPEIIHGTDSNDTLHGGHGDDVIIGYGGNDLLSGDLGDDVLFGGSGNDALYGGGGLNYVYAMAGADRVFSFASVDDYVLLDSFAPFRAITRELVATWFGTAELDALFAPTGIIGDIVISTYFVFVGESE